MISLTERAVKVHQSATMLLISVQTFSVNLRALGPLIKAFIHNSNSAGKPSRDTDTSLEEVVFLV